MRKLITALAPAAVLSIWVPPVLAPSHAWEVREVFSNADGTIQFIEMRECCGLTMENNIGNKHIESDVTLMVYIIPAPIAGNTAQRHLLFATQGFADLGIVTPDFIIPNNLFSINGDTVRYGVNPPANQYDSFTFPAGVLPTDCQGSIQVPQPGNDAFIVAAATPTNFGGETGVVDCAQPQCPWDCDGSGDGIVAVTDLLAMLAQYDPASPVGCTGGSCDYDGSGCVDVVDLLKLLAHYDPAGIGCP